MDEDLDEKVPLRRVLEIEGCSRSTLYARVAAKKFPPPIPNPDGRRQNRWWMSELREHRRQERAMLDELAKKCAREAA